MIRKLLAVTALLVLGSTSAVAFDGYVDVTNNTGYTIYFLYISHDKAKTWEEDVLGDDILTSGNTVRVNIRGAKSSIFDLRAEDEDGDTYTLWNVDIAREDVVLTLGDLD